MFYIVIAEQLIRKTQTTSHGFAADLLAAQRISTASRQHDADMMQTCRQQLNSCFSTTIFIVTSVRNVKWRVCCLMRTIKQLLKPVVA
jgi:hypothetical protein